MQEDQARARAEGGFVTFRQQASFGLHMLVMMGTFYAMGHVAGGALTGQPAFVGCPASHSLTCRQCAAYGCSACPGGMTRHRNVVFSHCICAPTTEAGRWPGWPHSRHAAGDAAAHPALQLLSRAGAQQAATR